MSDESECSDSPVHNSALMSALKEAWGHGYDAAVKTLRELGSDEQTKSALLKMAAILEEAKPQ